MIIVSFIVGLSISEQIFHTFILENMKKFSALKAIWAKSKELIFIILFQTAFTSLIGYWLCIVLAILLIALAKLRLPGYASKITYGNLGLTFTIVVIIAAIQVISVS